MYLDDYNKYSCSGCTACSNICPRNAIKMVRDSEGFRYPVIDEGKCTNCNACVRICPNIKKHKENKIMNTYGVKHKDENQRRTSRSGAVFIAISDYILNNDGVIYGSKINDDFSVSHARATTKDERDLFKGSKYVQSDMNYIILEVKKDLQAGKKVLFSGTACQVAGVKAVIPESLQENLYTCDLICHGVPSNKVYEDFLEYNEKTHNKKIKQFIFRDKRFGWETHYETIIFEDDTEISTQYFRNLFYGHNILRPSCHECNFANQNRPADITIADFWGIENINIEFKDELGVSLTIINNKKGQELFDNVKHELEVIDCPIEDAIKNTYTLNNPTPEAPEREKFWKDYLENNFEYIIENYAK